jgi:hypothetical protein
MRTLSAEVLVLQLLFAAEFFSEVTTIAGKVAETHLLIALAIVLTRLKASYGVCYLLNAAG